MHFCHSDGTIGRVVNARRRNGGGGWEAMIIWYNADGTAEPMSEGDEECTSDGTWHLTVARRRTGSMCALQVCVCAGPMIRDVEQTPIVDK